MKGIFSALMVPYNLDGTINEKGLRELVRHNIDVMKVDGLYVGGSTGENFMISTEEKKEVFRIAMEEAKNEVQMMAQVGSINVKESVELGKYATELGYPCLSAVTPFYYKFSFEEIKEYYETIVRETQNNMVIYSIPFLTGVNMDVAQFGELFANPKIIGVKFTAGDFYLLERMRKAYPDKLILSGFDEMLLPAVVMGVDGAIGSTYNVNGIRAKEIFQLGKEGNIAEALELQHVTNDLIEGILGNGLYPTIKEILKCQGVHAGICRKPMAATTEEQTKVAKELYQKYLAK
ncbi:N-acetylneuraminate lyase [Fusobacterium necrophorum subsp. funduliforme]|uniref:N-acetylneuraminate lyase n=3 Tax=Fusobacterium necrophorum TaxID=859 RepID=A0AAN4ATW3_9FUSO|nr:N-acetylneuraminate lyase [Fusobacterium necrophorum]AYV95449.1 N-acetylneuraminate lyase [Fusobacterium necrophorum subsp. funduliforme]EJU18875.1 N-acetylneuraminate lyase [Fusobacterium necrophorum subsp. funduliforme Fnf 1007]KYL02209.1 N-acetylneuraminate lyase [Fusobacterium necrophorum subsp. funduliforme]KYL03659.1 N-acetylneuraminate lyase [Fusobacterium necrophorum subsp. funduliforme]KYM38838.1 N-acetylneuraminate lyase [Fusobacterium necrophorum subsp. funduliforme]